MSQTGTKLEEARFFLKHIDHSKTQYPDFDYYLNAFLGSARSILWVMKAEYQKVNGWKQWHDSKQLDAEDQALFDAINDVRIRSVKKASIETQLVAIVDMAATRTEANAALLASDIPGQVDVVPLDGSQATLEILRENRPIAYGVLKAVHRTVNEFPDDDIVNICKRYFERLEDLVNECSATFAL